MVEIVYRQSFGRLRVREAPLHFFGTGIALEDLQTTSVDRLKGFSGEEPLGKGK
jgi:hypothetical protein